MRCRTASRLMSLSLDRTIRPDDSTLLSEHLARCARCRATWQAMQHAEDMLRRSPQLDPSSDLPRRVLRRLPVERRTIVPTVPVWTRASLVVMALLVALFLAGGITIALLGGVVPGPGELSLALRGQGDVFTAGWNSMQHLSSALSHVVSALWLGLGWPWLLLLVLLVATGGTLWVWLWKRNRTG